MDKPTTEELEMMLSVLRATVSADKILSSRADKKIEELQAQVTKMQPAYDAFAGVEDPDKFMEKAEQKESMLLQAFDLLRQTQAFLKHTDRLSCNCDGCSWLLRYQELFPKTESDQS
jgi:hypothetical protein